MSTSLTELVGAETVGTIEKILDAGTNEFSELLKIGELDPRVDLRGADLRGVDFGKADFNEWDLTGADFSKVQNIERAIFTNDTIFSDTLLPDGLAIQDLL